jgi:hypothetical protein
MIASVCASYYRNEHVVSVLLANIKEYLNITAVKLSNSAFINVYSEVI